MRRPIRFKVLTFVLLAIFSGQIGCSRQDLPNAHVVDPGVLLRSGQPNSLGLAALRDEHGVKTIINLNGRTEENDLVPTLTLGMAYVPMPWDVYHITRDELITFLRSVEQAKADGRVPVLVHCQFGEDRTGIAVATYRVVEQGWSAERAIEEMQGYRGWTHRLLIPHLDNIVRDIADHREQWKEDAVEPGNVPLILPSTQPAVRPASRPAATRVGS